MFVKLAEMETFCLENEQNFYWVLFTKRKKDKDSKEKLFFFFMDLFIVGE